ncbi:MAG: hypothetical protein ACFE0O_13905 [Opitutales bacterium]
MATALHGLDSGPTRDKPIVRDGQLAGVPYQTVVPPDASGNWVVWVHPYYFESLPQTADIPYTREPFTTFLEAGWSITTSAYRENGLIPEKATQDLMALIRHLDPDGKVLLLGEASGGASFFHLVEQTDIPVTGGILFGAGWESIAPGSRLGRPVAPLLLTANQSEIEPLQAYQLAAQNRPSAVPVTVAVIERDGHMMIGRGEYRAAASAVLQALEPDGDWPTLRNLTLPATLPAEPNERSTVDGVPVVTGRVTAIDPAFGNLRTTIGPRDLEALDLDAGQPFQVDFPGRHETPLPVRPVASWAEPGLEPGDWISFIDADGRLLVARFAASASRPFALQPGDSIRVRPEAD